MVQKEADLNQQTTGATIAQSVQWLGYKLQAVELWFECWRGQEIYNLCVVQNGSGNHLAS